VLPISEHASALSVNQISFCVRMCPRERYVSLKCPIRGTLCPMSQKFVLCPWDTIMSRVATLNGTMEEKHQTSVSFSLAGKSPREISKDLARIGVSRRLVDRTLKKCRETGSIKNATAADES